MSDSSDSSADESYGYDPNGDRTSADNTNGSNTYSTGPANQVTDDGTYTYTYNADGNLLQKTSDATGAYSVYLYDDRNNLSEVDDYDAEGDGTGVTYYAYDVFNNLVDVTTGSIYGPHLGLVYDNPMQNGQAVLEFHYTPKTTRRWPRILPTDSWGPAVDQLLADEQIGSLDSAGTVNWQLGDNQNTIRDVVQYNSGTGVTSVVDHITYSSFGQPLTNTAADPPRSTPSSAIPAGSTIRQLVSNGISTAGTIPRPARGSARIRSALRLGMWISQDT